MQINYLYILVFLCLFILKIHRKNIHLGLMDLNKSMLNMFFVENDSSVYFSYPDKIIYYVFDVIILIFSITYYFIDNIMVNCVSFCV